MRLLMFFVQTACHTGYSCELPDDIAQEHLWKIRCSLYSAAVQSCESAWHRKEYCWIAYGHSKRAPLICSCEGPRRAWLPMSYLQMLCQNFMDTLANVWRPLAACPSRVFFCAVSANASWSWLALTAHGMTHYHTGMGEIHVLGCHAC